jgi:hypothetical protein
LSGPPENHSIRSTATSTARLLSFDKTLLSLRTYPIAEAVNYQQAINLTIVVIVGMMMLSMAWVGYVGSDDHSYARGALGWLAHFPRPYVGDDHWTLRHPVVVPIAVSLALFGFREISLGLPSAFLFLLFLVVNYFYLQRFLGASVALLSAVMLATTPLFAVQATFPQDVIIQILAVSVSFWLFYSAARSKRPAWLMFTSGLAAALAWLTLETTAGLLLFYAILFLIGVRVPRRFYWIMAFAFLLIVGAEMIYFTALAGDPLYRYRIDLHHDIVDRVGEVRLANQSGRLFDIEGNLAVNVLLQPLLALLLNQEFGILFWAFVPASIWVWKTKTTLLEDRRLIRLLSGLGLVWIIFVSVNASVLWVVPRYYSVASWAAVIVVVYWLRHFVLARWPKVAIFAGVGFIAINLLCVYVENKNPLFAERALVDYVTQHRGSIYTDPMTMTRAKLLLEFQGVSERVLSDPVPPGALVYVNMANIERCKRTGDRCKWRWERYLPKEGWRELARIDSQPKVIGVLLGLLGLDQIIPNEIFNRLAGRNAGAAVYLVNS